MKLNLGCGADFREGYLNTDILLPPQGLEIEKKARNFDFRQSDASNLSWLEDNSVEEILAKDIIDHIHWKKIPDTFKEWKRVLKSGGHLYIRDVPNFEKAAKDYFQSQREDKDWENLQKWVERLSCPNKQMRSKNLLDSVYLRKMLEDKDFMIEKEWLDDERMNIDCRKLP